MPNAQPGPPIDQVDMDLDETTFVTLVTAASQNGSPERASEAASVQTPAGVRLPQAHLQDADDEHSDSPAVPSPSFSGFHSSRSSPGARLTSRYHRETEEGNLEGHTLVGEAQSVLADTPNQDQSALSYVSANQSFSQPSESPQQDRQVVEETLAISTESGGNGADSLLSVVAPHVAPVPGDDLNSERSSPVRSEVEESLEIRKESSPQKPAWEDLFKMLRSGQAETDNTDQDRDEADDLNDDREDHDSLVHSEHSLHLTPRPSPPASTRSSRKSFPSTQGSQSQKSKNDPTLEESPAASTRSKKPTRPSNSQPNLSQASGVVDLTMSSPAPSYPEGGGSQDGESGLVTKPEGDDDTLPRSDRTSSGKMQRMKEVSVSPNSSQKKSKKRSSRK